MLFCRFGGLRLGRLDVDPGAGGRSGLGRRIMKWRTVDLLIAINRRKAVFAVLLENIRTGLVVVNLLLLSYPAA